MGALVAVTLALAGASTFNPPFPTPPSTVSADAAVVLSGDVNYLRVSRAAALWRDGAVRVVIVSGRGAGGDSGESLRAESIRLGVEPAAVIAESESRTTHDNLANVLPIIRERRFQRLVLITSKSHMGRALRTARRAGPDLVWIAVPVPDAGAELSLRQMRLMEWVKWAHYFVRGWA